MRRRWLDALFIVQVILNILILGMAVGLMYSASLDLKEAALRQSEANARAIEILQTQNDIAICSLHASIAATKQIGLYLGLPVEGIHPPSVQDLNCQQYLGEP